MSPRFRIFFGKSLFFYLLPVWVAASFFYWNTLLPSMTTNFVRNELDLEDLHQPSGLEAREATVCSSNFVLRLSESTVRFVFLVIVWCEFVLILPTGFIAHSDSNFSRICSTYAFFCMLVRFRKCCLDFPCFIFSLIFLFWRNGSSSRVFGPWETISLIVFGPDSLFEPTSEKFNPTLDLRASRHLFSFWIRFWRDPLFLVCIDFRFSLPTLCWANLAAFWC